MNRFKKLGNTQHRRVERRQIPALNGYTDLNVTWLHQLKTTFIVDASDSKNGTEYDQVPDWILL